VHRFRVRFGVAPALFAVAAAVATACEEDLAPEPRQPDGFADALALAVLEDLDPDPRVLEVSLEARVQELEIVPGLRTPAWTYAGSLPGPLLRLRAGDRLVVHFKNSLPEPTTVHWHGVRVPVGMDGAVPHSQEPVPPGGTFEYEFDVPDPGLFWYHPHEHSAAQLGFGLYGALLVDPAEPEPEPLGDEVVMVLSDISIDAAGALASPDAGGDIATLFGREGAYVLVNGRRVPKLLARSGLAQRWRIVNTAKARYFLLALPGHTFTRIGGDTGLLAEPVVSNEILVLPGARADVVVRPTGKPGDVVPLTWIPFDRGYGSTELRYPETILDVEIADGATVAAKALPALGPGAEALSTAGATPVDVRLTQALDAEGKLVLGINGQPSWLAPPLQAAVGETQVWTVTNEMEWAHPFHLHGFFFQVLDDAGQHAAPLEWLDTANVPANGTLRFVVRYDARPGMWMFHCHILDHADAGMMGMVNVGR
jgi:FtsP/CotA-like multicopper oxidase with cupredoxin domain